jgi:hypothetical protein
MHLEDYVHIRCSKNHHNLNLEFSQLSQAQEDDLSERHRQEFFIPLPAVRISFLVVTY